MDDSLSAGGFGIEAESERHTERGGGLIRTRFAHTIGVLTLLSGLSASAEEKQRTVRFDIGRPSQRAEGHWNQVDLPRRVGVAIRHAVDSEGDTTNVSFRQMKPFSGYGANGIVGQGPFPDKASQDSFYLQAVKDEQSMAAIRLEGLDAGSLYKVTCFASVGAQVRNATTQFRITDDPKPLNPINNSLRTVVFEDVKADKKGGITIEVEPAPAQQSAYLGIVEIEGSIKVARPTEVVAPPGPPYVAFGVLVVALCGSGTFLVRAAGQSATTFLLLGLIVACGGLGYGTLLPVAAEDVAVRADLSHSLMMIGLLLVLGGVAERLLAASKFGRSIETGDGMASDTEIAPAAEVAPPTATPPSNST